jgi:hypothetical protein
LIGLTNLWINRRPLMLPKLNMRRAVFVLGKIDEILAWDRDRDRERDMRFVELGRYLCEARSGQYWRLDRLKSFDEFLERRFPDSRRKAYYLMAIHEHLTRIPKQQLKEVGWTKATELAKVARRDREHFASATWLHKARVLPKEEFKREVERHLTGRETEAWELVYFKLYKSQLPVIEQALDTAGLMLGTDKSRGYCFEMICADFLAGANLEAGDPDALLLSVRRLLGMLSVAQKREVLEQIGATA